jgi:diguanylate cyclase (GGDEF)-like protein
MIIDYVRKYNTDSRLRTIFVTQLAFTAAAMVSDMAYFLLLNTPGQTVHVFLCIALFCYYTFQVLAYYYVPLFINYFIFKDRDKNLRFTCIVWIINIIHICLLLANIRYPFYFSVSPQNEFTHGDYYIIRMVISYLPALISVCDLILASRMHKLTVFALLVVFLIITSLGSAVDIIFNTYSLVWPCFSAALLYAYFFIIRNDTKIDILTGLGNRYAFNEFVEKLSRSGRAELRVPFKPKRRQPEQESLPRILKKRKDAESYSIVMIDMDHFKEINDTMGHLEGDNALRDMALVIKNCVRNSDFAARYGGDEFVLATKAEYDVTVLLDRIKAAIDELNGTQKRPYKLQISYGYDKFTTNSGLSINDFLKHIDSLMYKQKNERRRASDIAQANMQAAAAKGEPDGILLP